MRVIAGKVRRMTLVTPPGNEVRPTTDRIKETLFNILQGDLYECEFLDLFSGSGGIGIEALSRGAKKAVFVDKNKDYFTSFEENSTIELADSDTLIETERYDNIGLFFFGSEFDQMNNIRLYFANM